jgi:hypothetical protein
MKDLSSFYPGELTVRVLAPFFMVEVVMTSIDYVNLITRMSDRR